MPVPRLHRGGESLSDVHRDLDVSSEVRRDLDDIFADAGIEEKPQNDPEEIEDMPSGLKKNGEERIDGKVGKFSGRLCDGHGVEVGVKRLEHEERNENETGKTGNETSDGQLRETVKTETWENLEDQLSWNHQRVVNCLSTLLNVVPTSGEVGKQCGENIQGLQDQREWFEWNLHHLRNLSERRSVRLCGPQANPEEIEGQGEILQTSTIPLSEVKKEIGEWKEAMSNEYHSLVHETKAIEPVDLSQLNPEEIEFVPRKLVTVRKAGPNGGKKKCRAVVCGHLLQSDADPIPGSLYMHLVRMAC